MKILLINCSSDIPEFAIAENNQLIVNEKMDRDSNADSLIYSLNNSLRKNNLFKNKLFFDNFDFVSVSNGPGSFTGLRVALSVAKGLCYAGNQKLILISSLDIIAQSFLDAEKNYIRDFIAAIPSNMKSGDMYFAVYNSHNGLINKISDYGIDNLQNLQNQNLQITEKTGNEMLSQLKLTLLRIDNNNFDDVFTSEPFYLKEFVPLKSKGEK
ncbi:MAG: tRNA (adenosine(37)-N6)-threonylcarbamoyltransferase complex dimerization subunit type 1 TsaB [Ignavibacteria bacterium]|nr:tRNA (adenosine(37)-N6)-threonylcarbamoyltransferase complex dimerization subunit type 1 TsaB [Ignavibacteria bacterium]